MADIDPKRIPGRWREGYALDYHTKSSIPIGHNEYGHLLFDTTRSEIGELLFRLKNRSDDSVIDDIASAAHAFLMRWNPPIDVIVPTPSSERVLPPVLLLGNKIADLTGITFSPQAVKRIREIPQLKNVYDYDDRIEILHGAFDVDRTIIQGRNVLLFDDLYRSGATMNEITAALYDRGEAANVYALTITRTRSLR